MLKTYRFRMNLLFFAKNILTGIALGMACLLVGNTIFFDTRLLNVLVLLGL